MFTPTKRGAGGKRLSHVEVGGGSTTSLSFFKLGRLKF